MECGNVSVLVVTINVLNSSIVVLEKETRHKGDNKKFRQQGMGTIKIKRGAGKKGAVFEVLIVMLLKTEVCCDVTACRLVNTGHVSKDSSAYIFRVKSQNHENSRFAGVEGCVFG